MRLRLHNYRCFDSGIFDILEHNFAIIDENGSGKTSLLCAIYSIQTGQPWPGTKFAHYLQSGKQYFGVSTRDNSWFLNAKIIPSGRVSTKFCKPNTDNLQYLTYQPNDNLWLFSSRASKLGVLDQIISQQNITFLTKITELNKLAKSKLELLKHTNQSGEFDSITAKFLSDKILGISLEIWEMRRIFFIKWLEQLPQFSTLIKNKMSEWNLPWEISNFDGKKIKIKNLDSKIATNFQTDFDWQKLWQKELLLEKVLFGAQRDDFMVILNSINLENVLSRGEMRLFVLFSKKIGLDPANIIWLLDDIFNELDDKREQILLDHIFFGCKQLIATGTRCNILNLQKYSVSELLLSHR